MTVPTITLEWLEARCMRTECGCLVWKGYIDTKRTGQEAPYARPTKDSNPMPVRRLAWKLRTGKAPRPKDRISRGCETYGCVEPTCLERHGPADKLLGRRLPLVMRAKIAATQQAKASSGLDADKAREIRMAATTNEVEAKLRGVSETTIAEIRRGTRWREYTGPMATIVTHLK